MRTPRSVSEGGENRVSAERNSVLHSWCIQAQWDAPTVIGGAGARLHLEDGRSILDMSSRAECVMLNKGPRIVTTVKFLADILGRMEEHHDKRMALLRRLSVSQF